MPLEPFTRKPRTAMMTLPFSQAAPFPPQAFERPQPGMQSFKPLMDPNNRPRNPGLPPGMQGVETRARLERPAMPTVNTSASDRVAALGRNASIPLPNNPAPAPARLPSVASAPVSPLGGTDARPLSARGPARLPAGVGTTNPNAVRVTPMRMPGERPLAIAARRGDVRAAGMLYGAGQQAASEQMNRAFQTWRDNQQASLRSSERMQERGFQQEDQQQQQAFQMWRDSQEAQRREAELTQGRNWQIEDRTATWQREDAQRKQDGQLTVRPIEGTDYVIPVMGSRPMGTIPVKQKEQPLPPGMVPRSATRDGVTYTPKDGMVQEAPSGIQYEKDPAGRITGAVYPMQDPQTGQWKLQRLDLNGDGVVSPQEQATAGAGAPQGGERKTKSGVTWSRA